MNQTPQPKPDLEGASVLLMLLILCDFLFVCLAPPGQSSASMAKLFASLTASVAGFWIVGAADLKTKIGTYAGGFTGGFALFVLVFLYFNSTELEPGCKVSVYANKNDWQSTGMFVQSDQQVLIKANNEKWSITRANKKSKSIECNADGIERHAKGAYFQSARLGALIARIGDDGDSFELGMNANRHMLSRTNGSGYLQLMCNDDYFGDNSGSIGVVLMKEWKNPLIVEGFEVVNNALQGNK